MILTNKIINKDITLKEVIKEYNLIRNYALKNKINNLNKLNDYELFIFIIADTFNFRKDFKKSVENALYHLNDKEKAIKLFMKKDDDYLGII